MTDFVTGEGGMLHVKKHLGKWVKGEQECVEGEMTNGTRQKLEDCKGKRTLVMEELSTSTSGAICESETNEGQRKAVCINECETNEKCAQLCMDHNEAITDGEFKITLKKEELEEFNSRIEEIFPGTLLVEGSLNKHLPRFENVILYPDWRCQDAVDIQEDGSLRVKEKRNAGQVLHYGEFCIEALDQGLEKGKYRVKTTWLKESKEGLVEKEYVYYSVILCISIVCLIVTIVIYRVFPALLRTMYNRIMINFAWSLLLAFLSLVVMQNMPTDDQTRTTCIGLSLLNQFAILSAFSLLTLMSYNIFVQVYKMSPQQGIDKYFLLRVALCYIVPGLITLVTLIVELTAPQCASVRPKFGTRYNDASGKRSWRKKIFLFLFRYCHFYGGVDKFIWLYLPILVLLLVNTGMFIYILTNICKTE